MTLSSDRPLEAHLCIELSVEVRDSVEQRWDEYGIGVPTGRDSHTLDPNGRRLF
jgi:hypothetical protein